MLNTGRSKAKVTNTPQKWTCKQPEWALLIWTQTHRWHYLVNTDNNSHTKKQEQKLSKIANESMIAHFSCIACVKSAQHFASSTLCSATTLFNHLVSLEIQHTTGHDDNVEKKFCKCNEKDQKKTQTTKKWHVHKHSQPLPWGPAWSSDASRFYWWSLRCPCSFTAVHLRWIQLILQYSERHKSVHLTEVKGRPCRTQRHEHMLLRRCQ